MRYLMSFVGLIFFVITIKAQSAGHVQTLPAKSQEVTYHGTVLEIDLSTLEMKKAHSLLISLHCTVELIDLEVLITDEKGNIVDDHEFHHTSAEHYMLNTDLLEHGTYHYDIIVDHRDFKHGDFVI